MTTSGLNSNYLIELSKSEGGPSISVKYRLGFDLVDLLYETVPRDVQPASSPIEVISRVTSAGELPDHLGDPNGFHVVSERMRAIMAPVMKQVAFHPATVELTKPGGKDVDIGGGPVLDGYWWMHCWNLLDLVSRGESDVIEYPFGSTGRDTAVRFATWRRLLLKELPPDEHYFGLLGLKGGRRFFSPQLWKALRQGGIKVLAQPMFLDAALPSAARDQAIDEIFRR